MNIATLNEQHGIPGILTFSGGPGDFVYAQIDNDLATATVCLYAGQVLSYRPRTADSDLLFVSKQAYFAEGKAIKGGIPLCWPWFGPDPDGQGRATHGFLRNRPWSVLDSKTLANGATELRLIATDDEASRAIWARAFAVVLAITVGKTLNISLMTRNVEQTPLSLTQGLHTYFVVGDIAKTEVLGLDGLRYIDKVAGGIEAMQSGPVRIDGEVDRIYTEVDGRLTIVDRALNREIMIDATGTRSAVVWNPWREKAAAMADFGDGEYATMLCVETTNAGPDQIVIPPRGEYSLTVGYTIVAS